MSANFLDNFALINKSIIEIRLLYILKNTRSLSSTDDQW